MDSSYLLGLFYIACASFLWAGSSVFVQFIYTLGGGDSDDQSEDASTSLSPFLVTYIGVSLFTILLPAEAVNEYIRRTCCGSSKSYEYDSGYERIHSFHDNNTIDVEENSVILCGKLNDNKDDDDVSPPSTFIDDGVSTLYPDEDETSQLAKPWTDQDHIWLAAQIAPVWFFGNWAANASLQYTSVSASMVMASTSSLFTFLMALAARDEKFSYLKLGGVVLGIVGSALTALNDTENDASARDFPYAIWGDALAIISAIGYAGYAVQTHLLCPHDDSLYSMHTLLGYVGLISMVTLSPVAIYQIVNVGGVPWMSLGFAVLNGIFDNVLSDYFCLRSVVLTDATVATVGLGLVIPLAFICDIAMGKGDNVLGLYSLLGALAVAIGFVMVNIPASVEEVASPLSSPAVSKIDSDPYQNTAIRIQCANETTISFNKNDQTRFPDYMATI